MTLKEAMAKGITELRLPMWNPNAKLSLQKLPSGKFGPWAAVHDYGTPEEGMPYMCLMDTDDRWEEAKDWKPMPPRGRGRGPANHELQISGFGEDVMTPEENLCPSCLEYGWKQPMIQCKECHHPYCDGELGDDGICVGCRPENPVLPL